tara:strand:+ start:255 stop:674 length:420 start_codon:yes stop_codon:yes gene_type:complete
MAGTTPSDTRAQRVSTTLTFTNVGTSETARQAVVFQDTWRGSTTPGNDWSLDGWNLYRDGGTAGSVVSTLRFYSTAAAGTLLHMNTATLADNDEAGGEYGIAKSLALADYAALSVSMENDSGSDQDYKLTVWLRSVRRV